MTRGIRKGLTPQGILEVAFRVIDADGADALTMRRLGEELGVAAMAIYNHFPNRDALLNALAEQAFDSLPIETGSGNWRARLKGLISAVHSVAAAHPNIYSLIMSRPAKPKASLALMSQAMDALRETGLSEQDAVRWYQTLLILFHGYPSWRAAHERFCSMGENEPDFANITPQQWKDSRNVRSVSADDQFDRAVDLLLEALQPRG